MTNGIAILSTLYPLPSTSVTLSLPDLVALSARSLRGNWVRTALTMLGVFMGVAAVNATLQVRVISQNVLTQELEKRVAPQIFIGAYNAKTYQEVLTLQDMTFLRQRLANLKAVSASVYSFGGKVIFQDKSMDSSTWGVTEDFLKTSGRKLVMGQFFTPRDFEDYRPVVVIDEFLRDQLFEKQYPVGQRLYVAGRPYIVIGIAQTKLFRKKDKPDGELWMPITLTQALNGGQKGVNTIALRPSSIEEIDTMEDRVKKLIEQKYPGAETYTYSNATDLREQMKSLNFAANALLAVGLIALLISGVGIANITVATVIERTSEIGLRLALGATKRDILMQFVLEAVILSLVSGVVAIVSIHGVTTVVAQTFKLPYQFAPTTAAWSLAAAVLVGVGAVYVPARRASQLDPVYALRSG